MFSIATSTVQNHVRNILAKLEVHSRLEAVTLAIREGVRVRRPMIAERRTARG